MTKLSQKCAESEEVRDRLADEMTWQLLSCSTVKHWQLCFSNLLLRSEEGKKETFFSFHSVQTVDQSSLCSFPSWQPGSFLTLPCCFLLAEMPFISHLIHLYLALFHYIFFSFFEKPRSLMQLAFLVECSSLTQSTFSYTLSLPESHNHSLSTTLSFSASPL